MKKKVSFDKKIDFPTMIGEISAISLESDLRFIDDSNVSGNLLLNGKYKLTEASRLEEDFHYKIPVEVALTEKVDLNSTKIDISDFTYEIENEEGINCHIELEIEGLEVIEEESYANEERECDGDDISEKEIEIPHVEIEAREENETEEINYIEEVEEETKKVTDHSIFLNLSDEEETYGTFLVYIVRQNESINSILEKYNTTLEEVEKYNNLNDFNIGSKLIIPLLHD